MKKTLSVFTAVTTIMWLVSGLFVAFPAGAVTFVDGDIVRETSEFDVYIIKLVGSKQFKRLILNPDVFNMYGHLKWSNIKVVADGTLDAYTTSDLVRALGDEKVYQLYPSGDTGTKKWVESLSCFTSKGFDWDSVYVINSFDRDSYTTASTTLCGVEVPVGALTLSLASDTPAASTVPKNGYGVTFMKVSVAGSGTISQLTIKRDGAGSVDDFDNVYIYENGNRLTSGRTISSATGKVTFIGLELKAPTTFEVVGDLSATAGNQDYFSILSASDVTATATVGGTFPISGNKMSMSGTDAGTLTVSRSGSTAYNVTIGEKDKEVSAFKVQANTEGAKISRIQLFDSGTATSTKLENLKLKVDGTTVATAASVNSDGYAVFVLATPVEILKGSSKIFTVSCDIAGKPGETIIFYLELATDIHGVGTTYGYGMTPTITNYDNDTYVTATLVGGDLTLVKNGPNAANVGDDTSDTVFLEVAMSAAADITISRTRLAWCWDDAGNDAWDDPYATAGDSFDDVEDVKIVNKDTGVVWAGPHDGSAFSTEGTNYCPDDAEALYKDFTDTFDLTAGSTYNLQVTGDVTITNTAETAQLTAGDAIKVIWYSYATLVGASGNVNYIKYTNTTNAVDDSAIIPTSDITGETMTIQTASLTVALAGSPAGTDDSGAVGTARKFVSNEKGVSTVGFVFTAGVASSIKVTALNLTGYADCDDNGTYGAGTEDTNCYVKNLVSSVEIWDTTTNAMVPGSLAKGFSGTGYKTVAYTGLNWVIPAGEARTLLVKSNLSSNVPSDSNGYDFVTFDIDAVGTDITCQDKDANSVTVANTDDVNGSTNPNVAVVIYSYGNVYVKKHNDTPVQSVLTMGSINNEVSKFVITAVREAFYVDTFSVWIDQDTASRSNFTGTALKYQTEAQYGTSDYTISAKKQFGSTASLSFTFEGSARPYAPKDVNGDITVLADVEGYAGGQGAKSADYVVFSAVLEDSGVFKAYGAKSGHQLNGGDSGVYAETTNQGQMLTTGMSTHYIFRARPVFAKKAWSGDANELARFTVTAQGYDVTFDGTSSDGFGCESTDTAGVVEVCESAVSASLEFDVLASGTDSTFQTLYLYDWNNTIISSVTNALLSHADLTTDTAASVSCGADALSASGDAGETCLTSFSFQFEESSSAVVVGQNVTREFYVTIDNLVDFNNQDESIQLKLLNDQGTVTNGTKPNRDNCNVVWYDGTDDESTMFAQSRNEDWGHALCLPANTHGIGEFPFSFRQYVGTAQ